MRFAHIPPTFEVKVLEGGLMPTRATEGAAGYDVYARLPQEYQLLPGQTLKIPLGFALSIADPSLCAMLLPRSGLGSRGLTLTNTVGLIDSDYQGEIVASVRLRDHTDPLTIHPGDRIAQLLFLPVVHPELEPVQEFSLEMARGSKGFGSTGVRTERAPLYSYEDIMSTTH